MPFVLKIMKFDFIIALLEVRKGSCFIIVYVWGTCTSVYVYESLGNSNEIFPCFKKTSEVLMSH